MLTGHMLTHCYCCCDLAPLFFKVGGLRLDSHLSPLSTNTAKHTHSATQIQWLTLLYTSRKCHFCFSTEAERNPTHHWGWNYKPHMRGLLILLLQVHSRLTICKDELKNWGRQGGGVTVCKPPPPPHPPPADSFTLSPPSLPSCSLLHSIIPSP